MGVSSLKWGGITKIYVEFNSYIKDWIYSIKYWSLLSDSAAIVIMNITEKHQARLALTQVYIQKF